MFINNSNSFSYSDYEPGVGLSTPESDDIDYDLQEWPGDPSDEDEDGGLE